MKKKDRERPSGVLKVTQLTVKLRPVLLSPSSMLSS